MLDRTATTVTESAETPRPGEPARHASSNPILNLPQRIAQTYRQRGLRGLAQLYWQFLVGRSLTRRIVFLNVAGLLALVIGILYLSQFRAGLIDARVQSLVVQGEIIASAIAASATADSYSTITDPDRLLELQPGESYGPGDEGLTGLEFSINPGARSRRRCAA